MRTFHFEPFFPLGDAEKIFFHSTLLNSQMTFNIRYYVSFARYFHRIFCCCRLTSRATANVHSLNFCRLSISPVHEFSPFRSMPVSFPQLFQILQQQIRQRKKELLGKMEFSGWQRCAKKHYSVIHYITSVN